MLYFDNAASAKPCEEAIAALSKVLTSNYANPSALHKGGIEAEKIITDSRENLLSRLSGFGKKGSLIFTSGATESNSLALLNSVKSRKGNRIVTTATEHPSVSRAVDKLAQEGFEVVRLSPKDGGGRFEEYIIENVDDNTVMVSVTSVCGETGFLTDVDFLYREIKRRFPDCLFHTDGAQGFLKTNINGDLISLSAHKIGGVAGVGGLFINEGVRVTPQMFGGEQQKGVRPGTEPTALIAAFSAATDSYCGEINLHFKELNERLRRGLENLPNIKINSRDGVYNILNFSCGVKSEIMLHFLAEKNIYVSSGSACARGKKSQILPAFGIGGQDIDSALRVSFGRQNTFDEVAVFLETLEEGIKRFRR
ncbi:MAG: aminotransferase class V-fold PLP-dependent enzyme [Oscillospiraceae bacterium]|nr:aminotransferase class V-fold PLP-dependent enzyme [Oscillospiraceae bacterium]